MQSLFKNFTFRPRPCLKQRAYSSYIYSKSTAPESSATQTLFDDDSPADLTEDNEAVNRAHGGSVDEESTLIKGTKLQTPEDYRRHRVVMKEKFPEGWNPPRKLSRDAMDALRDLHRLDPEAFSTPVLASRFRISAEAVRRILKSKYVPTVERSEQMHAKYKRFLEERRRNQAQGEQSEQDLVGKMKDRVFSELNRRSRTPLGINRNDKLGLE